MYGAIQDYSGVLLSAVYFQQMISIVKNTQDVGSQAGITLTFQKVLDN